MVMEAAQRLINVSLGKIASSRSQRGGQRLHRSLLVAGVLMNARTASIRFSQSTGSRGVGRASFDHQQTDIHQHDDDDDEFGDESYDDETTEDATSPLIDDSPTSSGACDGLASTTAAQPSSSASRTADEIDAVGELVVDSSPFISADCLSLSSCQEADVRLAADSSTWVSSSGAGGGFEDLVHVSHRGRRAYAVRSSPAAPVHLHQHLCPRGHRGRVRSKRHLDDGYDADDDDGSDYESYATTVIRSCKRSRYDSTSAYEAVASDCHGGLVRVAADSSTGDEAMQTDSVQLTSLVQSFSNGFSGLVSNGGSNCDPFGSAYHVADELCCSGIGDEHDRLSSSTTSDSIISCSIQIREALETLQRPVLAMSV